MYDLFKHSVELNFYFSISFRNELFLRYFVSWYMCVKGACNNGLFTIPKLYIVCLEFYNLSMVNKIDAKSHIMNYCVFTWNRRCPCSSQTSL